MNLHDQDIIRVARREALAEGRSMGVTEGARQKAVEAAIELLKEKVASETIAKCVKLPLDQVLELQKQITLQT